VPLETAVVATVIFRASYYILPLALTLLFLRPMLAAGRPSLRPAPSPEPSTR
jgi:hypothetical protein